MYCTHKNVFHFLLIIQEARSIPFVGDRLADKIHEIITSGHLRRLDLVDKEKKGTIERFQNIHGVGTTTAEQFYAKVNVILRHVHVQ